MKNQYKLLILSLLVPLYITLQISGCHKSTPSKEIMRVAQFNIRELSTDKLTDVDSSGVGQNEQVNAAAAIIRKINPDVLVLNEIDHDIDALRKGHDLSLNAQRFIDAYLNQGDNPLSYPYLYAAPCNTGRLSDEDLDNNGIIATQADHRTRIYGGDCFGYGEYPGQYSMAVLSRFPLQSEKARTFQTFLWKDLPDPVIPKDWYSPGELEIFRLSSKSHWDLPVNIGDKVIHLLVSHPTPPGFDGPENRNGRRNYDEIRMWVHYLNHDSVLVDDEGVRGGLAQDASFILAGDLNAAPRGDTLATGQRAIDQLLNHPHIQDCGHLLTSQGALQGRKPGPPEFIERRTAAWGDRGLRIDHLLPSTDLKPINGGVFWPDSSDDSEGAALAKKASDHRLIWLDLNIVREMDK
ncbi:MAG: endonuclease/exonuclease/phosphatase family protein [candidate division KSB1 bacterium]|nr:endonuclease/exonuclease/phosphatase family protein [candidate division KSB1 bacterium]